MDELCGLQKIGPLFFEIWASNGTLPITCWALSLLGLSGPNGLLDFM